MKWRDVLRSVGGMIGDELDRRGTNPRCVDTTTCATIPNTDPCGECGYLYSLEFLHVGADKWGCCVVGDTPRIRKREDVIANCEHFGCS